MTNVISKMNLKAFFASCLIEGLPIKIYQYCISQPQSLSDLEDADCELFQCIHGYIHDQDLVELYRKASALDYSSIEASIYASDFQKLFNELADRYESLNPSIRSKYLPLSFGSICDYLNPLKDRQTYVLKNKIHHWMYEEILQSLQVNKLLEVGIFYGGSTHAWRLRLPDAKMYSLDINYPLQDSKLLDRVGSKFTRGSATNHLVLDTLLENSPFDLIIDDASHIPSHQISTFLYLVNNNAFDGVYVVEDVHDFQINNHAFARFMAILGAYQEDCNDLNFLSRTRELLCGDTVGLLDEVEKMPLGIKCLQSINISRYGDNYVFSK